MCIELVTGYYEERIPSSMVLFGGTANSRRRTTPALHIRFYTDLDVAHANPRNTRAISLGEGTKVNFAILSLIYMNFGF